MSWRYNLAPHLFNSEFNQVYEFGVFSGQSIIDLINVYKQRRIPLDCVFGFDSFEGMPESDKEEVWQDCWAAGQFDARKHFGQSSIEDTIEKIREFIYEATAKSISVELIPGFYEDSLKPNLITQYTMFPACYVDIDCDIYESTITALDFMFSNGLIVPGTIVGYDDWGGSKGWEQLLSGESRAHKEMIEKYNIECEELFQCGQSYPHVQKAFRIRSIG